MTAFSVLVPRARTWVAAACVAACLPLAASAATLTRARITVDATQPSGPAIGMELTLASDSQKPVNSVDFYVAREVSIASAKTENQDLTLESSEVPDTILKKWTVKLPVPLTSAQTRVITFQLTAQPGNPQIQWDANGGWLLPGSGWFPSLSASVDPIVAHSTTLTLASGMSGIACGNISSAGGPYAAITPGRPFAAWGRYTVTKEKHGVTELAIWRRPADSANPDAIKLATSLWESLSIGLGPACGSGELRLVEVSNDVLAAGQRTLFWNESQFGAKSSSSNAKLTSRDLAVALSSSFWTDCLSFSGEHGAWFSRSFPDYLGDVAFVHASRPDRPEKMEAEVFKSNRDHFQRIRAQDHALKGLPIHSPAADEVLLSRGTLLVHMLAEAAPSRDYWLAFLGQLRTRATATLTTSVFLDALKARFPNQHGFAPPYLNETALPDFKVVSSISGQGLQKDRVRVEVQNSGTVEGSIEVAMVSASGDVLRSTRLNVPPKEKRAVLFKEESDADRIMLDPRGVSLQSDITNDVTKLSGKSKDAAESFIPSYAFEGRLDDARKANGLKIVLDAVTISDFNGVVIPYKTSQGVSGASLLGKGKVQITPDGAQAESWTKAMQEASKTFDGSEMWVRFPIEKWREIETQLGDPAGSQQRSALLERNRPVYEFSFPTYFFEEMRAQIPPEGSSLVVFTGGGGELRGFVRRPEPDGHVMMRFWDQLAGTTIWEETR